MNPLKALSEHGQSIWLDFLARGFTASGQLQRLVDTDGLAGVTSNPAIFEKAIGEGSDYDAALRAAQAKGDRAVGDLYEELAVADIRAAADVLKPVFDKTRGGDGFVSLEVSPYLAMDADGTAIEARRFWRAVDRRNLMVKVPATKPGLAAIRTLTGEGLNINITLLFGRAIYEAVAEAYVAGLEDFLAKGGDVSKVASVASFFVSRIDTAVDALLDQKIREANDPDEKAALAALKGKVAIANAKLAYQSYKRIFSGERWEKLALKGAKPQRLLWASTGTKNKAYSDVLYVEELIGPNTVNTLPPATMDAFRDHGKIRPTLEDAVDEAERVLAALDRAGISLDRVTDQLIEDGVRLFADAADKLLGAVARKRAVVLGPRLNRQSAVLGKDLEAAVVQTLEQWRADGNGRRLWQKDSSLWTGGDEAKWLDWLTVVEEELKRVDELEKFGKDVRRESFSDVVLVGMGGSSLGPEVLGATFGRASGWPKLHVLDSTDPAQIKAVDNSIDIKNTLFIVSSKSGSTLEPNILKAYFYERTKKALGAARVGSRFVAVTDPGSSLEKTAQQEGFRRIFYGLPGIGGRYSVLSRFGLVPAAAAGVDVKALLQTSEEMVRSCGPDVPPSENPGIQLGAALGTAGLAGRDKVTFVASPGIADFGGWAEQLIAESTGKHGKGLIPVDGEPLGAPTVYGDDRLFMYLRLDDGADAAQDAAVDAIEKAGHPVVRIALASPAHIGQEFFRFEIATAVAGAIIGIHPFDQPDVEASKVKTRELTAAYEKIGALPAEKPAFSDPFLSVFADEANVAALRKAGANGTLESWMKAHLSRVRPGDYVALLAYLARNERHMSALQDMRVQVRDNRRVATCAEFGPRFLHSSGQAYKGGPASGVFVQITTEPPEDLPVPGAAYAFGVVEAAQARGDFEVLAERGRRLLRVHFKGDIAAGMRSLQHAVKRALG
jgi:transaldolase / glucose-6-phosphate isomerase